MHRNRFTRLGLHFAFVACFAMLGGALRGLNLLLVLAGLMVAALMMQWRWCKRSTESLSIDRRLPTEAFAQTPFRVRFRLTNWNRFLPIWMLRIEDTIEPSHPDENKSISQKLLGNSENTTRTTAKTGIGVIAGRQTASPSFGCQITDRGVYSFGPLSVSTTFPFALMRSNMTIAERQTLDVYPRLIPLRRGWTKRLFSRTGGSTVGANRNGTDDGEFFGLREYHPGDNPKWIHWRTTARLGELAVRQFEEQRRYDVCVLVDAWNPSATDRGSTLNQEDSNSPMNSGRPAHQSDAEAAETAISLAATLLVDLSSSPGNRILLAAAGRQADAVIGGASFEYRKRIFGSLARIQTAPAPQLHQALDRAVSLTGVPRDLIIVSPRSRAKAIREDADLKLSLQGWGRRGQVRWLDVNSDDVKRMIDEAELTSRVDHANPPQSAPQEHRSSGGMG
ncbi:MAG: DUF58 domain-containing protein [Planctomycetota bacterium]